MENKLSDSGDIIEFTGSAIGVVNNSTGSVNIGRDVNVKINNYNKQSVRNIDVEFQLVDKLDSYQGREEDFKKLHDLFFQREERMAIVCGMAGIGKTEFARQFVHEYRNKFDNVLWINSDKVEDIEESFKSLAKRQDLPTIDFESVYMHFKKTISIFVFDNVENQKSFTIFKPRSRFGYFILVTSQFKDWDKVPSILLEGLSVDSSIKVLKSVIGNEYNAKIKNDQLKKLASILEYIPLALQIGTSFIRQQIKDTEAINEEYRIENFISKYEEKVDRVKDEFPPSTAMYYFKSTYNAILVTVDRIRNLNTMDSELALTLLYISSYLNPDYLYENDFMKLNEIQNKKEIFKKSLAILVNFSLIRIENHWLGKRIRIHRLVLDSIRLHHNNDEHYKLALNYLSPKSVHRASLIKNGENNTEALVQFFVANHDDHLRFALFCYGSDELLARLVDKTDTTAELLTDVGSLHGATAGNHINIIKRLLQCNVNVNARYGDEKRTVLFFARTKECVQALVEGGADVKITDECDGNPLCYAVEQGRWQAATCLLQNEADVEGVLFILTSKSSDAKFDEVTHFSRMLAPHIDTSIMDHKGRSVLHISAKRGNYKLLRWLIQERWAGVNHRDNSGCTVLHVLCGTYIKSEEDTLALITWMVCDHGADPSIKSNEDKTPADWARWRWDRVTAWLEFFQRLINGGVDISATNCNPLVCAVIQGNWRLATRLVQSKDADREGDVDLILHSVLHALICEAEGDKFEDVTQFARVLPSQIDTSITDNSGRSVLHMAAERGNYKLLRWLVEERWAEVNHRDDSGCTVLHVLCNTRWKGEEETLTLITRIVREHGADPRIRNNKDNTPADWARWRWRGSWDRVADWLDSQR